MSVSCVQLCSALLMEQFGDLVSLVGTYLMNNSSLPLVFIVKGTGIKLNQVKRALAILIQHNLCTYRQGLKGITEYAINHNDVLYCLHYPRYVYCAKSLYDSAAELIVEGLVQRGRSTLSDVLHKTKNRLDEALVSQGSTKISNEVLISNFSNLVKLHFVKRCKVPRQSSPASSVCPSTSTVTSDQFQCPSSEEINSFVGKKRKIKSGESEVPSKMQKTSEENRNEEYWSINPPRFYHFFRDQFLISAITRKVDQKAGEIVRTILRLSEVSTNTESCSTVPVSVHEIFSALPKDLNVTRQSLNQYMKILTDDSSGIVNKVDESCGGSYSIHILNGLTSITKAHIESIVLERYGSKSLRIFRLLLLKDHCEQKQIEDSVMMNVKEVKELLYHLYSEGYVVATELCKTPDHAPARTTFLFAVDLPSVARLVQENCYKSINNSMSRRNFELINNRRLLDKQQKVEAILASLNDNGASDEQKAEIDDLLLPSEKSLIDKINLAIKKLDQCELRVAETLLVMNLFLLYQTYNKVTKGK